MVMELIRLNKCGVNDVGTGNGVRVGDLFESKTTQLYHEIKKFNGANDVKIASIEEGFWRKDEITEFETKLKNYLY
jgi:hypothetical protein